MKRYAILIIVLVVVLGASFWIINKKRRTTEVPKMRLVVSPYLANLPLFVCLEKGYFQEEGLAIETVQAADPGEALNAVLAGRADMGAAGLTGSFAAAGKAPTALQLFMPIAETGDSPTSYLLVQPGSTVNSLADLKGKRIGTYTGGTQLLFLKLFLERSGIGVEEVQIIQVDPKLQGQALAAGQFDSLFTVEPYSTIALAKGEARSLVDGPRTRYILSPFWAGSAIVSNKYAQDNQSTVTAAKKAIDRAIDFIRQNPDEAKSILPKYTPLDAQIASRANLYVWKKSTEEVDYAGLDELISLLRTNKLLNDPVDARALFR